MKIEDIDPNIRRVAAAKQREMEAKYLRVRLKRCERGIVNPVGWEMMWRKFIKQSVARAVTSYLATNKAGTRASSEQPTAVLNAAPATQVAQPSTTVVEGSKRI